MPKTSLHTEKDSTVEGYKHLHVRSKLNKIPKIATVLRSLQVQPLTEMPVFSYVFKARTDLDIAEIRICESIFIGVNIS